jgi:integrase
MKDAARKILLPHFVVTEVASENDDGAIAVTIPKSALTPGGTYHVRHKRVAGESERRDGKPRWVEHRFNLFPIILDGMGVPWAEANVYLLSRLEDAVMPAMSTYSSIAEDLAAYRRFLDETRLDWLHFPSQKLSRPTYRYNGHLKSLLSAGEIATATAKRRMGTVIGFYNWLKRENVLMPEHPPWKEADRYIDIKDRYGFKHLKKVVTTDVSIRIAKQDDPYDGTINDDGKLRPLSQDEQAWLIDALVSLGNTEMTLIHLMGLLTGARIQTILTLRVRHVQQEVGDDQKERTLRLPVGPGTGIDTKWDKQMVLHIPIWFYRMLRTYAHSDRARKRREQAAGGDSQNQYLFLSVRSNPLYRSKEASRAFDATNALRHAKVGQGVRQFITDYVIPYVRQQYGVKNFRYRFHDTRATFGMNLTDHQFDLVEQGKTTLKAVREFVKTRMGHESSATTDLYLHYRQTQKLVRRVGEEYESHLQRLAERAMENLF